MANLKTRVSVQFQHMPPGQPRPFDYIQEEPLRFEVPYGTPIATVPIPAVGDTVGVSLETSGGPRDYRVLTRHFEYLHHPDIGLEVIVNIVVTDVNDKEMLERLKQ
ncbi:MAG: hypothetical protein WB780_02355 [Candidatus Acidiferrales bacterium]